MSMWSDEDSAELFAPTEGSDLPLGELGLDRLPSAPSGWTPADGFPDSTGSVRVWVDETRRLTNVVVSNRWRERSKGTTLASMFDEAFLLAQARLGVPAPVEPAQPSRVPPLSWDSLAEMRLRSFEIDEERARLDSLPKSELRVSRWVGEPVEGDSSNQMVVVRLNIFGLTEQVRFDEDWVASSRVAQVCEGVMEAHQDAYSRYVPASYELGDRDRLSHRSRELSTTLLAMVKRGR